MTISSVKMACLKILKSRMGLTLVKKCVNVLVKTGCAA